MHIPAHVPAKDQSRFRNWKGDLSQNVLAACTFDLQFIFIYPGWEGSAADSRVLRAVLDDPDQNFPPIPEGCEYHLFFAICVLSLICLLVRNTLFVRVYLFYNTGKYYLVDSGYLNMEGFIAPYHGIRSQLHEYVGANQLPRNAKELFNHRHSSLRKAIRRSFDVLKTRFPILKLAPQYAFHTQRDIVIAACVIHNLIRHEERNDWLFASVEGGITEELPDPDDQPDMHMAMPIQEQLASAFRDSVAESMWNDFLNKWDEW